MSVQEQLGDLLQGTSPPLRVHRLCDEIERRVLQLVSARWPEVSFFASTYGGFKHDNLATSDSDLSLSIACLQPMDRGQVKRRMIEGKPEWRDVRTIGEALVGSCHPQLPGSPAWKMAFSQVRAFPEASVPFVEFRARQKDFDIKVEVAIDNYLGKFASDLVREYIFLQPVLLPLLYQGVKAWLKHEGLTDGPFNIPSYAIKVIVINYLQHRGFLPDLQDAALLDQLHIPRNHLPVHRSYRTREKRSTFQAAFFRASNCSFTAGLHKHIIEGEGGSFAYYLHDTEKHREPPAVPGRDTLPGEDPSDRVPPNRTGLHRLAEDASPIEELFPQLFPWLYEHIRLDTAGQASPRSRAFSITPSALPSPASTHSSDNDAALFVQDPFLPERNVAHSVRGQAVARKLEEATRRAMGIVAAPERMGSLQALWTDEEVGPGSGREGGLGPYFAWA